MALQVTETNSILELFDHQYQLDVVPAQTPLSLDDEDTVFDLVTYEVGREKLVVEDVITLIQLAEPIIQLITVAEQGLRGPRGFSNYQLAVQNGYVGTEQEYLVSLTPQGAIDDRVGETDTDFVALLQGALNP